MIPRTPFARIGLFCLQNNMVPDKWRDFMRKNRLMPQKEVALVSRHLKIGPCNPLSKAHPQINILAWCWYLGNNKFISIMFIENNFWDQGFIVLGKRTANSILFKYWDWDLGSWLLLSILIWVGDFLFLSVRFLWVYGWVRNDNITWYQ